MLSSIWSSISLINQPDDNEDTALIVSCLPEVKNYEDGKFRRWRL